MICWLWRAGGREVAGRDVMGDKRRGVNHRSVNCILQGNESILNRVYRVPETLGWSNNKNEHLKRASI